MRAFAPSRPPVTAPVDRVYEGKVTVARARVDVPMLVLRARMAQSHRLPDRREGGPLHRQRGDITLTRMGLARPRRLRAVKAKSCDGRRGYRSHMKDSMARAASFGAT